MKLNNMRKSKYFWNAVVDEDLFYTIFDYISFNKEARDKFNITTLGYFNKYSVNEWKELAKYTIDWLENTQLTKIYVIKQDDNSPSKDTWGTLYYQTLAYMDSVWPKYQFKPIRSMNFEELTNVCVECINNFKKLAEQIRELNDNDLENI